MLLPLCRKYGLPLLLRMGTARQMNADLRLAGDGVGSARLDALTKLCAAHPNVKFLVTVLDAAQQHAAAVIASRFRNVHCWGSWWFSALPSVAAESSKMRVEMLGTQFTFAASSAKLHDQLIYKWLHGRSLLTSVLTDRYAALAKHGWRVSRGDIRRDVNRASAERTRSSFRRSYDRKDEHEVCDVGAVSGFGGFGGCSSRDNGWTSFIRQNVLEEATGWIGRLTTVGMVDWLCIPCARTIQPARGRRQAERLYELTSVAIFVVKATCRVSSSSTSPVRPSDVMRSVRLCRTEREPSWGAPQQLVCIMPRARRSRRHVVSGRPGAGERVARLSARCIVGPVARCSACGRLNQPRTRLHTGTVTGRLHRVQDSERIDYRLGRLDLAYRESPMNRRSYSTSTDN